MTEYLPSQPAPWSIEVEVEARAESGFSVHIKTRGLNPLEAAVLRQRCEIVALECRQLFELQRGVKGLSDSLDAVRVRLLTIPKGQ